MENRLTWNEIQKKISGYMGRTNGRWIVRRGDKQKQVKKGTSSIPLKAMTDKTVIVHKTLKVKTECYRALESHSNIYVELFGLV